MRCVEMDFQDYEQLQVKIDEWLERLEKKNEKAKNPFKAFDRVTTFAYRQQAQRATLEGATVAEVDGDLCLVVFDRSDIEQAMKCKRLGIEKTRCLWLDWRNLK